jgi:hypothetical protein
VQKRAKLDQNPSPVRRNSCSTTTEPTKPIPPVMSTSVCASNVLRIEGENGAVVLEEEEEGMEEEEEEDEAEAEVEEEETEAAEKAEGGRANEEANEDEEEDEGTTWREGDVAAAAMAPARGRVGWTKESAETIWLEEVGFFFLSRRVGERATLFELSLSFLSFFLPSPSLRFGKQPPPTRYNFHRSMPEHPGQHQTSSSRSKEAKSDPLISSERGQKKSSRKCFAAERAFCSLFSSLSRSPPPLSLERILTHSTHRYPMKEKEALGRRECEKAEGEKKRLVKGAVAEKSVSFFFFVVSSFEKKEKRNSSSCLFPSDPTLSFLSLSRASFYISNGLSLPLSVVKNKTKDNHTSGFGFVCVCATRRGRNQK